MMQNVFDMVVENAKVIDETQQPVEVFGELGITAEPIEEVVEPEEEITEEPEEYLMGNVTAKELYIREAPNKNADSLCTIKKGTEVMIDEVASTEDFYSVVTESGIEGFCMKQFIKIQ